MNSLFGKLNSADFLKGLLLTVLTTILAGTVSALNAYLTTGTALPDAKGWEVIILAGVSAGVAYLLKNLGTNSQGKLLTKEPK